MLDMVTLIQLEHIKHTTLAGGPNLKAYYRRGQARIGLHAFKLAVDDLQLAKQMCPTDDGAQQALIDAQLSQARAGLGETPDAGDSRPASYNDGSVTIEETVYEPVQTPKPVHSTLQRVGSTRPPVDRDAAHAHLDAMRKMPDDQLRQAARAAGIPEMDGPFAKQVWCFSYCVGVEQPTLYFELKENNEYFL